VVGGWLATGGCASAFRGVSTLEGVITGTFEGAGTLAGGTATPAGAGTCTGGNGVAVELCSGVAVDFGNGGG
jgi:hypothetical protein